LRTIKFGIIGCGLMGKEFASAAARWMHISGVEARPKIISVSDINPQARAWFEANLELSQSTGDYSELLANPEIEAVYVAVPHHLHAELYAAAIRAGKHLFAEKPFGIDLEACETIIKVMSENPNILVRCSSEFPFFPAVQRIAKLLQSNFFGQIIELRAGFLHSSDLDPTKPINWKRQIEFNGEYGCMGDLGLHVLHFPLRFGFTPKNVRAHLSNIITERPNTQGTLVPCETWDNAILSCESTTGIPMILETKRISPGDTNTWYLEILGTQGSAKFSTKYPKALQTLSFQPGQKQAWQTEDLGYESCYPAITGHIFEFGFPDAILQMWASFLDELAGNEPKFRCATPEEAHQSHLLFTAALKSHLSGQVVTL
jgi:predicted dehydrogenase